MQLPEYNILEARQVRILKQIYELKQQVECLCVAVRLSDVNNPAEILDKLNLNIEADEVFIVIGLYCYFCFWSTGSYLLLVFVCPVDTDTR